MIVADYYIKLPGYKQDLRISYFGDLHIGSRSTDEKRLIDDLEECNEDDFNWSIFTGDQTDAIIPKDAARFRLESAAPWMYNHLVGAPPHRKDIPNVQPQESDKTGFLDKQLNHTYLKLKHRRVDRIIGFLDGNHEDAIHKWHGRDLTSALQEKLDPEGKHTQLLGFSCFIRIHVEIGRSSRYLVTTYVHHGWGGASRTEGYNLTKYGRQLPYFDANIFCFSHCHDIQNKVIPQLSAGDGRENPTDRSDRPQLKEKEQLLLVTGTYKKTLIEGQRVPTWDETKGFPPRKLGYVTARTKFYNNGKIRMGYEVF